MKTLHAFATAALLSLLAFPLQAQQSAPEMRISPWGIGSSAMRSKDHPKWIPQMAQIGISELRAGRSGWGGIEPEKGKFNFAALDEQLRFLEEHQIRSGALLLGIPKWEANRKGLPMNSLPEWSNYVSALAAHTKGRIKHFEVWNEPPNGTNNAPPSDYGKLAATTYDAAKKANPDCLVGLAAKSVHINYLEQAIKGGARNHFDYVTLHPYEVLGCIEDTPGTEPIYMSIVPTLRKMLAAQNPEKKDAPLWLTEIGYDSKRGADRQSNAVIKAYTMGIAQGMECIMWFEGIDGDSGPLGLIAGNGTPRPAYVALGQLIKHLGKYPEPAGWVMLNDKHYGFVFNGAAGPVLVTWAATSAADKVNFGGEVEIVDPRTGNSSKASSHSLSIAPIIVLNPPAALVAQAKANIGKPLPWGGDYSGAKEVSVTMGAKNIEKGLHTKSAETLAADVVAYGGNARAGDIPGGNVFIVDPNFLSYDTVPIEISMVVKRNDKNEPAKLELEYESTSGYKKAPVYEIPEGSEWHTATWRIDDPQFVNMWAFNFRVNKGKYLVQKVSVKKL